MRVLHLGRVLPAERPRQGVIRDVRITASSVHGQYDWLNAVRPQSTIWVQLKEHDDSHSPTLRDNATTRIPARPYAGSPADS